MVAGCLFVSHFGDSDVCCEQRGGVVRVVSQRYLFGCVRQCDDGSHVAHGPPLESQDGALVVNLRRSHLPRLNGRIYALHALGAITSPSSSAGAAAAYLL